MHQRVNAMKRALRTSLLTAAGVILALAPGVAGAAPEAATAPHGAVWDAWQPLGGGFMGRRRVPARMELPAGERRSPATQERLAPGKSTKPWEQLSVWMYTAAPGLYGLTIDELAATTSLGASELRAAARSGRLSFANTGRNVSWYYDGNSDRLLFAGETYQTFHAEGNAYRLQQTQTPDPHRMIERYGQKQPPAAGLATPFREALHFEEETDMMYALWLDPTNADARYWFWDYLYGSTRPQIQVQLRVPNPSPLGAARLRVRLYGFTDLYPGNEHRVVAELNGRQVGSFVEWDGLTAAELVADFDQGVLNPSGDNVLTLIHAFSLTHPRSGQFLESIDLEYSRLPVAEDGRLWLRGAGKGTQAVTGFASREILVIESPVRGGIVRRDIRVYPHGAGWAVGFETQPGADYLIAEVGGLLPPVLDSHPQADLVAAGNRADYLIIAPREFEGATQALAGYRQSDYSPVQVVWLDDIYKVFSHGRIDPFAIGRFMEHARSRWALAPRVVTLLGKGSLDRKNRMGYGDSFLPILLTGNPWALAESDARLLGFADGVVPFAYGRIPIVNDAEGVAYVAKLKAGGSRVEGGLEKRAIVAADNPDSAGSFHDDAEQLAQQLGNLRFGEITRLYHPTHPVRAFLTSSQVWEADLVTFTGHGSTRQVGNSRENFLTGEDAAALGNRALPVFAALTCAVGANALPGVRSLTGELVLNPQGGAGAALAPSGLSLNSDAHVLGGAFLEYLFGRGGSVGEALAAATAQTRGGVAPFTAPMYTVIGDPGVGRP